MSGNRNSPIDRTGTIVTMGMLLLALLGIVTVFHEPITALFAPGGGEPSGSPTVEEHGAAASPGPAPARTR